MRMLFAILVYLILPNPAFAVDWVIGTPQEVVIKVSSKGGSLAGLTFSDFDVYIQCASNTTTIVDETGDTLTDNGGGAYTLNFNDDWFSSGKCDAGDQGLIWVVGTGDYLGLLAKTEEKFRAVNDTINKATCNFTAATDSQNFQIGACKDKSGKSLALTSGKWERWGIRAYTITGTQCNVEGETVQVLTSTLNGSNLDITVALDSSNRGDFSATPNTTNCGVKIVDN